MRALYLLAACCVLVAVHQQVDASFWDGIPIISQIKSAVQAISGDKEGAKKTQENFVNQAPVISQVNSAVKAAKGDKEGAKKTQEQFLHETVEPVAENTPGVGQIVGAAHIAAGDKERGEQIIKGASSNTAALIGGILCGPACAIGAGAATDGLITGIDSAVHGEFRPFGVVEYGDKAHKGELSAGDHFDFIAGLGAEALGGRGAKEGTRGKGDKPDGERVGASPGDAVIDINKLDGQTIRTDPTDGSHNIETGKKWKPPSQMTQREFDQVMSDMESGKLSRDFYHPELWPEPYRSKLEKEISKLSPEHKRHISGRDLRMIVNDEYGKMNCYYCSIARTVGLSVKEMEKKTGIKMNPAGEYIPRIMDIANRVGIKPNHVIRDASPADFQTRLQGLIGKNEHRRFLISYEYTNVQGAHMTNFEAWRTPDGKLHQLHKDFQQPFVHHHDRGTAPDSSGSRFYDNMPNNLKNLQLIEVRPEVRQEARRKRQAGFNLAEAREQTGLPAEIAAQLFEQDFEDIMDIAHELDPSGELTVIARSKGVHVSQLVKDLANNFNQRPPSTDALLALYKKLGFDHVTISKAMNSGQFMEYLGKQIKGGETTSFTLLYWPRSAPAAFQFLAAKAWKTGNGQLKLLTTDHAKESNLGRFSETLPNDALWSFAVTAYNARGIDPTNAATVTKKQVDQLYALKKGSDASGNKCGGERKRIVGYVTNWAKHTFTLDQAMRLTNAIYAFMEMDASGKLSLPGSRLAKERLVDIILAREAHQRVGLQFKISFAVGGWANSQHFSSVMSRPESRKFFIDEIVRIMSQYQLDGVDIDWEYPITGGANQGKKEDKGNYVAFLKELRDRLGPKKLISIAAAAGQEAFEGFDVPKLIKYVDWIGVMTYDFFGAWESQWGAFVGPLASLKHAAPPGYSGKLNVDWAMKQYSCQSEGFTDKLVMGVPFYGRYWFKTHPGKYDAQYPLFRQADRLNNGSYGGEAGYRELVEDWKLGFSKTIKRNWDDRSKTPWASDGNLVLTYENTRSITEKMKYAVEKNFGGVMIWAVDHDDKQGNLLQTVFQNACHKLTGAKKVNYKCNPLGTEKRWWTWLEDKQKAGMCGMNAPLYKGYYPRCDPDDPGYSCCSDKGFCGTGNDFCKCKGCVDYGSNPDLLIAKPVKPSGPIKWHVGYDIAKSGQPRCGPKAPKLPNNGGEPICNPDGNDHCCSPVGYCGSGADFCTCKGCVDSRKKTG